MLRTRTVSRAPRENFSAAPVPETSDLEELAAAAAKCKACPLWKKGTQTVFGEGRVEARIVFVGEQPGQAEDREGRPFVGPAGRMLDRALEAAGVDRSEVYVTNAVKHFKWEQKGKLHMHSTPNAAEIAACRPWLQAELRSIRPELVVCMGSTAAFSVLGRKIKILENRGKTFHSDDGLDVLITIHPSLLLRLQGHEEREEGFRQFVQDLKQVAKRREKPHAHASR